MKRAFLGVYLGFMCFPGLLLSQAQSGNQVPIWKIASFEAAGPLGGAGGGQAEPAAIRREAFTRLTVGATVSPLGTGAQLGTKLSPRFDARLFGNYLNLDHNFSDSGFRINLNIQMANAGAKVDFYPLHRLPLRITPGYLYFNQNQVRGDFSAGQGTVFTLNNVDYTSSDANPVRGTGRLLLGGSGFIATTGLGHIVSHDRKRLTFPFEIGAAFIHTPSVQFYLSGDVCNPDQTQCQPAAQFPTFAENLAAQLASWNRRAEPFHVYPILEGGVAYSFQFHRREFE